VAQGSWAKNHASSCIIKQDDNASRMMRRKPRSVACVGQQHYGRNNRNEDEIMPAREIRKSAVVQTADLGKMGVQPILTV
jgi:hypothetical protein